MWERNIIWLPLVHPYLGTWPASQACAPTRNITSDLLVCQLALSPLSHTSQGEKLQLLYTNTRELYPESPYFPCLWQHRNSRLERKTRQVVASTWTAQVVVESCIMREVTEKCKSGLKALKVLGI